MFMKLYMGGCAVFVLLLVLFFGRIQTDETFQHFMMLFAIVLLVTIPIKRRVKRPDGGR